VKGFQCLVAWLGFELWPGLSLLVFGQRPATTYDPKGRRMQRNNIVRSLSVPNQCCRCCLSRHPLCTLGCRLIMRWCLLVGKREQAIALDGMYIVPKDEMLWSMSTGRNGQRNTSTRSKANLQLLWHGGLVGWLRRLVGQGLAVGR